MTPLELGRRLSLSLATYHADIQNSKQRSAKMFISSMARKNLEKQKSMEKTKREKVRKNELATSEMAVSGQSPVFSTKGFSTKQSRRRNHQRAHSVPLPTGPPKSSVELVLNKSASAHKEEIQINPKKFDLVLDADDITDRFHSNEFDDEHDWFLNPIHRPSDLSIPFSELVQQRPLTASVMKATSDGVLMRDNNEDIADVPLHDFDMDIFRETDMEIYRNGIRKSLRLRSPFELELAKLKQEKLKLEEAYLLKMKCKAELEETRGPKPKWYEMKTKQFNTEIRKHNNLLENSGNWRSLIDYRNNLIEASGRWQNLRQ